MIKFVIKSLIIILLPILNHNRHKKINISLSVFFIVNIFSIVRFPNNPCQGTDSNGTCYSAEECSHRGGSSVGSCASGYGVCCTCKLILVEFSIC